MAAKLIDSEKPEDEIDLTDGQIQQLLLEAEMRMGPPETKSSELLTTNSASADKAKSESALLNIPGLSLDDFLRPYVRKESEVATTDSRVISSQRDMSIVHDQMWPSNKQGRNSLKDKTTAGSDWFDLPKTELTMELGRDLKLLRMRSVLDPKRHYKKENGNSGLPEFSQVATVIEGPTEFFSARITKKERKRTFVGEALVVERETRNFETKYNNIQASKRSGKKSFYRSLRARRSRKAFPLT